MIYNNSKVVVDDIHTACDDIQPVGLMIYTSLCSVMIYQSCDLDKKKTYYTVSLFLAGVVGIEPTPLESEANVLPLHHTPPNVVYYITFRYILQAFGISFDFKN